MPRIDLPPPFAHAPFATRVAEASGVGRGRLRGPDLVTPHRGVRVSAAARADQGTVGRARLLLPVMGDSWAFSHVTALGIWGLPLPLDVDRHGELHVSTGTGRGPRRSGVVAHRTTAGSAVVVDGLRVVDPLTAWVQSGTLLPLDDLVAVGDALCGDWSPHDSARRQARAALAVRVQRAAGLRGLTRVRAALDLVRAGVESPKETELRLLLQRAGLPEFELNVETFDEAGRYLGKPDLRHLASRVAVEYEGDEHRSDPARYRRDITRRERFADAGWRTIRVTQADLHGRAARELVGRVRRCLGRAGPAERSAMVPPASTGDPS